MATTQTHYDEQEKSIEDHLEVLATSDLPVSDSAETLLQTID